MDYSATSSSPSFPNAQPFVGVVENTIHALRLVQAARQGIIPRIIRRLNDSERREMITSGAVFVFSVEESGIKRWTDSMVWSPSRIVGNFLVYKEMWERNGGRRKGHALEDPNARAAQWNEQGSSEATTNHGPLKINGLLKKTITVTIDGSDLHLVSYYTQNDLQSRRLRRISSRPDIATLELQPHLFRFSSFRNPPKVVTGRDGRTTIVCEPEEAEPSESFTTQSPDRTSYSPEWSDGIEKQMFQQGLPASTSNQSFARGRRATMPSGPFLRDGWQGQFDPARTTTYEDRGEFHWPPTAPLEMQRGHVQADHRRPDAQYDPKPQQQKQQSWPQLSPPLSSARYTSMPPAFSAYPHRSPGKESEGDRPGGQTLIDEHASAFGNHPHYLAQDRHLGYDQPPWLSTNQDTTQQGSLSRPSSSNVSHFTMAHNEGNTDDVWSAKHIDGASHEHDYPGPESFPNATQAYGQNFYSIQPTTSSSEGQLYKINEYEGHYVSHKDVGGN